MKKSKKFMQSVFAMSLVGAVLLACSASLFAGCAGFTEDGNSGTASDQLIDANAISERFALARVMQTGTYSVNSTSDSITLIMETVGGCLKNDSAFVWDAGFYFADTMKYGYSFNGDTLLLSYSTLISNGIAGDSIADVSVAFIGGTSGKLDGIWKRLPCALSERMFGCSHDAYELFIQIKDGKIEYRIFDLADADYMHSIFVVELFMFMGNQNSIQLETPFYGSYFDGVKDRYNIEILEMTKKHMAFAFGEHHFGLNLNYAKFMDSVHVSLSDGSVTCEGYYREISNVSQEMCREDYANYFRMEKSGAVSYRKDNHIEFEDCINRILGRERDY